MQVFVIGGGESFDTYEEYIHYLKTREADFSRGNTKGWKDTFSEGLTDFEVLRPRMPSPENAKYSEWKIWFERLIPFIQDNVVMVGHSLGGIFLSKYLSENDFPKKIRATFLVGAPYNTEHEHPVADFIIQNDLQKFAAQAGEIFLYHSKDDTIVPFSNFESYQKALPKAHGLVFENRGHFIDETFPELVEEIKKLA